MPAALPHGFSWMSDAPAGAVGATTTVDVFVIVPDDEEEADDGLIVVGIVT